MLKFEGCMTFMPATLLSDLAPPPAMDRVMDRLERAKVLYDDGAIDDREYATMKKDILKEGEDPFQYMRLGF